MDADYQAYVSASVHSMCKQSKTVGLSTLPDIRPKYNTIAALCHIVAQSAKSFGHSMARYVRSGV